MTEGDLTYTDETRGRHPEIDLSQVPEKRFDELYETAEAQGLSPQLALERAIALQAVISALEDWGYYLWIHDEAGNAEGPLADEVLFQKLVGPYERGERSDYPEDVTVLFTAERESLQDSVSDDVIDNLIHFPRRE